jgi:hypothetical protein
MSNEINEKPSNQTAGAARERLGEILFTLAAFFGALHFVSIAGQVLVMYMHTALGKDIGFPLKSSMFMGNIYLGFLAAYVGRKEYVRWVSAPESDVLSKYVLLKLTRGEVIIVAWAMLTGLAGFIWQMGYINEVPQTLVWTLGEVVALWCGTSVLKYFKAASTTATVKETKNTIENFGERAVDYCKEKGSICNEDCQREFGLGRGQAYRLLKALVSDKRLKETGAGKASKYTLA